MPGLNPRGHAAGSSAIQTTCTMPARDPRQATVVTTWYPRGDEIYFDETGQYQFVVSGSNCTASVRRTRVLTRVVVKSATEPSTKSEATKPKTTTQPTVTVPKLAPLPPEARAPVAALPPPPARASQCAKVGKAAQLEVSPRTKLMRPGEKFTFRAIARDAAGCRTVIDTKFTLLNGKDGTLSSDGTVTVPESARAGNLEIEARVDDQSVRVIARVVTNEEYETLIQGGEYGVMGESLDGASVALSTTHVELDKQAPSDSGEQKDKGLLYLVGGLLLLLLGFATFLLTKRQAHLPGELPEELPDANDIEAGRHDEADSTKAEPEPPRQARLCPVCGQRYEDGTMFCGEDGARLVRSN